jgi:hypothetical protein
MFTATATSNHNNATISPETFSQAMRDHWEKTLGNTPSPSLMSLWGTMAKTFNTAIESDGTRWSVLQPPTGTGKTQGLSVFAALTAKANHDARSVKNGILIVTRLIEQADELRETINHLAGFECAVAKHSEIKVTPEAMRRADTLIITHTAYVLALEGLCQQDGSRWSDMIDWDHGKRRLTVIDEALANVIDEHQVRASDIRQVLSHIDAQMKTEFPEQVDALKAVESVLDKIAELNRSSPEDDDKNRSRVVWREVADGRVGFPAGLSMLPLRDALSDLRYDKIVLHKDSTLDRQRLAGYVDKTLSDVESILSKWAYYAKNGAEHTFNASRLLIPDDLPAR